MKKAFSLAVGLLGFSLLLPLHQGHAEAPKPTLRPLIESTYRFPVNESVIARGTPQYFSQFIDKDGHPLQSQAFQDSLTLDFPGYFQSRGRDDYAVMLGRVVFTVNNPITHYSRARLLDLQRMNQLIPEFPARRAPHEGPGVFTSNGSPSCKFKIEVFTREELLALGNSRPELRYAEKFHPDLGVPDVVSIQHNYDFGRVLGFKTSRGAITLTAHYARPPQQTLISTFSLGYLENTPPAIWGGPQLVMNTSRDTTLILIERLRKEPTGR